MSPRLEFALNVVYDAGRRTLAHFQSALEVKLKEDKSPVTAADLEAESLIRRALGQHFREDGILGEEEGESGRSDSRWVLDPIDGTKSFICGVPLYATLLSYERDGVPILGVCYFPALDEMLYAEAGRGAFLNGRRVKVSNKRTLGDATLSCASHSSMEKTRRAGPFLNLANKSRATRTWCDAYGHGLVAKGRIEAMVDPVLKRWDISPMQLIVEEAGGKFTDFEGNPNPQTEAVSSNGILHNEILSTFS